MARTLGVNDHAAVFRELFENRGQFRHFQPDLTGFSVLPNKSLANSAWCILDSANTTNLARLLSEASWQEDAVKRRRLRCMLQQTRSPSQLRRDSMVANDATRCAHVGSLFDHVARHDKHSEGTYPLAHHPVTRFYVSGLVRCPLGLRLQRRDDVRTQREEAVGNHFPAGQLPMHNQAQNRLHKQVDPVLLQDPEFRERPAPLRTTIALAVELVEEAIRGKVPFGVVVFDAGSLAEDLIRVLGRRRQAWLSRDANGWPLRLPGPHSVVEELVPLLPANAYRPITVRAHTYGGFTLAVRIRSLGKVQIVVSFETEPRTGRWVVLVTIRVDWSAAKIIGLYRHRSPPEIV